MRLLKQSSTAQPLVFLLVQSADHLTGLAGATPTVTLSKAGGAFAAAAGAVTEIGNGLYRVAANATDTNTLGPLYLHATATGADPTDQEYAVVAFDPQLNFSGTGSAGTLGGLPTVDANNRIVGVQSRSVSDGSVIGTSTPTTPQTISETTSSGNTLKVDARRLPRTRDEGRLVYSQNQWTTLNDFTITGTTPTITAANAIRLNPATAGSFDGQALEIKGVASSSNAYDIDVTFTVVALGASAYGVAIGRKSINTTYALSLSAHLNPVQAPNQLLFWPQASGGPANFISSNNVATTAAVGDSIRMRLSQDGPLVTVAVENLTQQTVARFTILDSLTPARTFGTPNTSTFRLFGLGGTFDVTSLVVTDRSPQYPLIACVGDSKTVGLCAGSQQASWVYLLNSLGPTANYGGEGDKTADVLQRLAELTVAPARYVILNIGRNDLASSIPAATWQANYAAIVAALKAVGSIVIHLLPIPETGVPNQSALTTYITTTYASDLRIDVSSQWSNATDLATDGAHPNAAGQLLIYKAIVASGYILPDLRFLAQVGNIPADYQQRGVAVTLPTLTAASFAAGSLVGLGDWAHDGDAMTLTPAERTATAAALWSDSGTYAAGTKGALVSALYSLLQTVSVEDAQTLADAAAELSTGATAVQLAAINTLLQALTTTIGTAGAGLTATAGLVWSDAASYATGTKGAITAALYTLLQTVNTETVQTLSDAAATLANGATAVQLAAVNTLVQAISSTIGTAGAGLTALPYNGPSPTAIQSGLAKTSDVTASLQQILAAVGSVAAVSGLTSQQAAQLLATYNKILTLGAGQITYTGPVLADGSALLVVGDDYTGAAALMWTISNYGGPDLTGATAQFGMTHVPAPGCTPAAVMSSFPLGAASITTTTVGGVTTVTAAVTLTHTDTSSLSVLPKDGPMNYLGQLRATVGGQQHTLVWAAVTVLNKLLP